MQITIMPLATASRCFLNFHQASCQAPACSASLMWATSSGAPAPSAAAVLPVLFLFQVNKGLTPSVRAIARSSLVANARIEPCEQQVRDQRADDRQHREHQDHGAREIDVLRNQRPQQ